MTSDTTGWSGLSPIVCVVLCVGEGSQHDFVEVTFD